MGRKYLGIVCLLLALAALSFGGAALEDDEAAEGERLRISTTTSLYDTGLLDEVEGLFEEMYDVDVDTVSGGTGIAIQYGERGDVDLILVHDVVRERKFIDEGYGQSRTCFAYNYFQIVGPEDDPAGIAGMNATEALKTIMEKGMDDPDNVKFISRGDDSGTHAREKLLWDKAGLDYETVKDSGAWYVEAGRGMGATLVMANELSGYTLTDTSTFLAFQGELNLATLVESDENLLNVYAAIPVSPATHPEVNCEMARNFVNFLVSEEGQSLIADFGTESYGRPLFNPATGNCDKMGCSEDECAMPLGEDFCLLASAEA